MPNYLKKFFGQRNDPVIPQEQIQQLALQNAQQQIQQPQQQQVLQGYTTPDDKDIVKKTALNLIMKQMEPVEVPQALTASDVMGQFKEGGFTKGIGSLLEFAGSPQIQELIGNIYGAKGDPYMQEQFLEGAEEDKAKLLLEQQEAKAAQERQQALAPELYKLVTEQEFEEEKIDFAKEKFNVENKINQAEKIAKESKDNFEAEEKIRKEFTKNSGDFLKVKDSYNRVLASVEDPSPAGDLALIFNYMKILDPGSVVRESEFATAENTGSIPQRVWKQYNKALIGERLAPTMRKDFADRADRLYKSKESTHSELINEYKRLAKEYKLKPENIIGTAPVKKKSEKIIKAKSEAEAMKLPKGTRVNINGRIGTVE